jgi:hypothetical protein
MGLKVETNEITTELKVETNVKHNGKWYKPGETIKDLSEQDYNRLTELQVDVRSEGVSAKGTGASRILDMTAPGGAKLTNRSEYIERTVDSEGNVWETYKK